MASYGLQGHPTSSKLITIDSSFLLVVNSRLIANKIIRGHGNLYQSKADTRLPISGY